jgi:hypothetical protein
MNSSAVVLVTVTGGVVDVAEPVYGDGARVILIDWDDLGEGGWTGLTRTEWIKGNIRDLVSIPGPLHPAVHEALRSLQRELEKDEDK